MTEKSFTCVWVGGRYQVWYGQSPVPAVFKKTTVVSIYQWGSQRGLEIPTWNMGYNIWWLKGLHLIHERPLIPGWADRRVRDDPRDSPPLHPCTHGGIFPATSSNMNGCSYLAKIHIQQLVNYHANIYMYICTNCRVQTKILWRYASFWIIQIQILFHHIHAREWDSHLVLIVLLDMVLRMEYPHWTQDVIGCLLAIR